MRRGIALVGAQSGFKGGSRFIQLVLVGVNDTQVVERLRQLWKVFGQLNEGPNRVCGLASVALRHTFEQSHLRVTRLVGKKAVSACQGINKLAFTRELRHVAVVVCKSRRRDQR